MAQRLLIDLKKLNRDLNRISENVLKMQDIATTRALNALLKQEEIDIKRDVSKEYGITQSAVKDKMKPTKATRVSKSIELKFKSTRMNIVKPKQLKRGGLSFQVIGGGRVKVTTKVNGGSRMFLINAKAGGQSGGDNIKVAGGNKKVPVYREDSTGKFRTLRGSSIAHMVNQLEIDDKRLLERIIRDFPEEYKKQLKSANKTGRF